MDQKCTEMGVLERHFSDPHSMRDEKNIIQIQSLGISSQSDEPGMERYLERVKGIEPSYEAWEAAVLPLNYTRSGVVPRPWAGQSRDYSAAFFGRGGGKPPRSGQSLR
jgi:hypothetical protein